MFHFLFRSHLSYCVLLLRIISREVGGNSRIDVDASVVSSCGDEPCSLRHFPKVHQKREPMSNLTENLRLYKKQHFLSRSLT